jgi:hypothetical protein
MFHPITNLQWCSASETLDKRLTIEEWVALLSIGNMAAFVGLGFANLMAAKIKSLSDTNSCGIVTGNIDGYAFFLIPLLLHFECQTLTWHRRINYQYHASTTGSKCDTTAQEKTIRDAINRGLDFMVKHNVNQACFNMQHGGTWKGLLQLASSDKTIINNRCDDVAYTIIV